MERAPDHRRREDHTDVGLEELRTQMIGGLVLLLVAIAFGLFWLIALTPTAWRLEPLGVIFGLVSTAGLARAALPWGTRPAAAVLVVGLGATVSYGADAFPRAGVVSADLLVVLIAGALLGWRGAATGWAGVSALLLLAPSAWPRVESGSSAHVMLGLVAIAAVLGWLLMRPLQEALTWSWTSYERALRKTEEARERQVELARVSKSLTEAYLRLEAANAELERARKAAVEARRLKAEFAAMLSHELRAPLNLVIGFSELLLLGQQRASPILPGLPEACRRDLEAIYRNACHLSNLVDDVLELSQLDAHRIAFQREPTALADVVAEAAEAVGEMYRQAGLELTVDLPADLPPLHLDRLRIRQTLINLLTNAVRYTARGGVRVGASLQGRDVVVRVADTGVGIPAEELPRVFEEFHRLAGAEDRRHSGLGLAICRRFVELHGGAIWVESRPGQGATFSFSLPLCDNVVVPADGWERPPRGLPREAARPVALVLTRNPELGRLLQRHLEGYRVIAATSAARAAAISRHHLVRAVIATDRDMLDDGRLEAGAGLRDVPRVVCPFRPVEAARRVDPATHYLPKPVTFERLRSRLEDLGVTPGRVLIVEDDPEMLLLLDRMIRQIAPAVRLGHAADGRECLERLRAAPRPDLVLLDLVLPGLNGYAVLEQMRADARLRDVPVVVISGEGAEGGAATSVPFVEISRPGGLSAVEALDQIQASLRLLLGEPGPVPALPAARAG